MDSSEESVGATKWNPFLVLEATIIDTRDLFWSTAKPARDIGVHGRIDHVRRYFL